jgi:hypothetical protein
MMTETEIQTAALQDQAQECLRQTILIRRNTFERLCQTGQPLDNDDRRLIRLVLNVAIGDALMGYR